jgi:two-component system chemotaxis response regulator CheB
MMKTNPIKVLLVDDSVLVTKVVSRIIEEDDRLQVLGTAADPFQAVEIMKKERPDVILLDIEMPRMDGLTFLLKIMTQHPIPVVIFSGVAPKYSYNAVKALEYGAVAVLQKPKSITSPEFEEAKTRFLETLKGAAAAGSNLRLIRKNFYPEKPSGEKTPAPGKTEPLLFLPSKEIIAIGSSTGGTQALEYLLSNLEPGLPAILITQHMPGEFTKAFADRLNQHSPLQVKEAEDGEIVKNNSVYIGNGFFHLMVEKTGTGFVVRLKDGPLVNRHKPSVDVLFRSVARHVGPRSTGILLTGMGNDGARGLLEMKQAGAMTIAQDKESSVVFGMPRAAIELGAANRVLSLHMILQHLKSYTIHY